MSDDVLQTKTQIDIVCQLALLVTESDLAALQQELDQMNALLPIIDPTAYRRILTTLPTHLGAVRAFVRFRAALAALELPPGGREG